MDSFPYKSNDMGSEEQISTKIKQIKSHIPSYSTDPYKPIGIIQKYGMIRGMLEQKYVKIITPESAYETVNILSDYFNEKSRMNCSFNYYMSPHTYHKKYKKKILFDLKAKNQKATNHAVREYIYENVKECNTFKITTAAFVYDYFKATHILDFSSGWGDRLTAACGLDRAYMGIDPNVDNHHGYNRIIKLGGTAGKQQVHRSGAEYLPDQLIQRHIKEWGQFDLIFTSPPFFDYEVYASDLQSISSYMTDSNHWIVYFLFVVLIKYIPYLKVGGTLGLYIQDIKGRLIVCEPLVLFIQTFYPNMKFIGIISERLPALFFRKEKDMLLETNKDAEKKFIEAYGPLYKLTHNLIKKKLFSMYEIDAVLTNSTLTDIGPNCSYARALFKYLLGTKSDRVVLSGSKSDERIAHVAKVCYLLDKECIYYCPKIEYDFDRFNDMTGSFDTIVITRSTMEAVSQYHLQIKEIDVEPNRDQLAYIRSVIPTDPHTLMFDLAESSESFVHILSETFLEMLSILQIDLKMKRQIYLGEVRPIFLRALYPLFPSASFAIKGSEQNQFDRCTYVESTPDLSDSDLSIQLPS